ncbi:SpoIIE family protein phosphatase [Actinoplanes sp. NPDC020271]|uniref:SpoIIE family protein phosphatase n=1 Tax=Actinoplanes sp. NPDC020271 TaxID=3363896 RepID=UPI0037B0D68B
MSEDPPAEPVEPLVESAEELYENAPCGYLSVLPDGALVRLNQTFLDWTGHRREDLLGRRIQELLGVGSRIFHETHLRPLLHMQGEVRGIAMEFRRADGTLLDTLVNAVLRGSPGTGAAVLRMTVFDATDRRSYERELLAERRRAERTTVRLRALQDMVMRCAAIERAGELVDPIVAAGNAAFEAATTTVWLLDAGGSVLTDAGSGSGSTATIALDGPSPQAGAARTGKLVGPGHGEVADQVSVPLAADDQVLGVVSFGFAGDRLFDTDELELMRTLGRQAGQALERARLYEETARRAWQSAFLARLGRDLDEPVAAADRARRLVSLVVPTLAEYAQVDLAHDERAGWLAGAAPLAATDPMGSPDPGGPWPLTDLVHETIRKVRSSGEARPVPLAAPGGRSAVGLPLRARGEVVGTLLLAGEPAVPDRMDVEFLIDVADRAGLALDNARLAERDREVALTLQRSLLAGERPIDSRFHLATVYRPAIETLEVGGDWYDAFITARGSVGVVVGDVVGRGVRAASAMGQLRSAVRALATAEPSPATVLQHMDDFVTTLEAGRMTTLAYAELALDTGRLRYACAGHPPPLLLSPGTGSSYLWEGRSGPLGTRAGNRRRREAEFDMPPGSRLLLYTDGLVERRGERIDEGLSRLTDALTGRWEIPLAVLAEQVSDAMLAGDGGHDDMCLLALAFDGAPRFDSDVPADMVALQPLRAELDSWLAGYGVPERERYGVVLACSEAVANAIEHGYQRNPAHRVRVSATIDANTVELRINDSGQWRAPQASIDRGRGMALMGRLMDDLVVDRGEGTTVLMRRTFGETRR